MFAPVIGFRTREHRTRDTVRTREHRTRDRDKTVNGFSFRIRERITQTTDSSKTLHIKQENANQDTRMQQRKRDETSP